MENVKKITKKNYFEALINFALNGALEYETEKDGVAEISMEQLEAFAKKEIENLDKKYQKQKENAAKKRSEADALTLLVAEELTDEFEPIADIAARVAEKDADATISKVTYRLTKLVESKVAEKAPMKIAGGDGKKARTIQSYRKIAVTEDIVEDIAAED